MGKNNNLRGKLALLLAVVLALAMLPAAVGEAFSFDLSGSENGTLGGFDTGEAAEDAPATGGFQAGQDGSQGASAQASGAVGTGIFADVTMVEDAEPNMAANAEPNMVANAEPNMAANAEPNMAANAEPNMAANAEPNMAANAEPNMAANAEPTAEPAQPAAEPAQTEAEAGTGAGELSEAFDAAAEGDTQADAGEADAAGTAGQDVAAPTYPADIVITAVGDCTLGGIAGQNTGNKFHAVAKANGPDYFLSNVRPIFEKDDLTIINLEGPLTNAKEVRQGQYYCFKGPPYYVQILTGSSVELCNVANNHSLDYKVEGLKDTAATLDEAGIGYCGYTKVYTTTIKGVRISALGFTKWDHSASDIRKAVAAARQDCDILIVNVHWGWEMAFAPDSQQRELGHTAVDAGADLVIGTHTHVYGGIEKYKGKYIIYSLGNFCFGGNSNPPDKRAYMFQQTLRYSPATGVSDMGINIVPVYVSSTDKTNDYHPKIMGKGDGTRLLKNIASVSRGMSTKNTIWMPDNYLVWAGIRTQEQLDAAYEKALAAWEKKAQPDVTADNFFEGTTDGATSDAIFME